MAKTRAHSDGALYLRIVHGRERWTGRVRLPDGTRKDVYGSTRAEARTKLEEVKEAASHGGVTTTKRQTTGDFLKRWLEDAARPSVRPTTYRGYEQRLRLYVIPHIGKVPLASLGPQHIQKIQNDLLARPLSAAMVLDARRVLSSALDQAVEWRLIPRNPASTTLVKMPSVQRPKPRPLDPEQGRQLLSALRGHRLEALYTVALALGLRGGEALGLKWEVVDFGQGRLAINRALYRVKGKLQLLDTKTSTSRRVVPLPLVAVRALRRHQKLQDVERGHALNLRTETGLIFTIQFGTPFEPRNLNRDFAALLKRAGLPHQRFHDLRHACASLLLAQGLELKVIQELLGHSTIAITGDVYAHLGMGLKQLAADAMDGLFDDGSEDEVERPSPTWLHCGALDAHLFRADRSR
jgi:integrase